jgi:hypothetical protein
MPIGGAETVDALFRTTKKYLLAALLLWLPASTAVICARSFVSRDGRTLSYYEIINTDEGEKVGATRLR